MIVILASMAGIIGARVHRVWKIEAELAFLDEDHYAHISSLRAEGNLQRATQFVEILSGCMDPSTGRRRPMIAWRFEV